MRIPIRDCIPQILRLLMWDGPDWTKWMCDAPLHGPSPAIRGPQRYSLIVFIVVLHRLVFFFSSISSSWIPHTVLIHNIHNSYCHSSVGFVVDLACLFTPFHLFGIIACQRISMSCFPPNKCLSIRDFQHFLPSSVARCSPASRLLASLLGLALCSPSYCGRRCDLCLRDRVLGGRCRIKMITCYYLLLFIESL